MYDGLGASGYAPYQGGGKEGGVPGHHVGGPLSVTIRDFIPHEAGVPLDPPPTLDHPWA